MPAASADHRDSAQRRASAERRLAAATSRSGRWEILDGAWTWVSSRANARILPERRRSHAMTPSTKSGPEIALVPPKRRALPDVIADLVAEAIAAQTFVAGERIVETALAARLHVSRVPVREALKILHTQGIIAGGGHRGYRVASFSPRMVQSVQEARIELEVLLLRDAVAHWRVDATTLPRLNEVIADMRAAARARDAPAVLRADIAFHEVICVAAQNPIFETLWRAIARHVLIILNLARFRDIDLGVVVRRHEALRDQIADRVAGGATVADLRSLLELHIQAEREPMTVDDAVTPRASRRRRAGTTRS
jgi:DNA-binding GntR family transcriptional regulator